MVYYDNIQKTYREELILTSVSGLITSQNLQQVHTWHVSRH